MDLDDLRSDATKKSMVFVFNFYKKNICGDFLILNLQ